MLLYFLKYIINNILYFVNITPQYKCLTQTQKKARFSSCLFGRPPLGLEPSDIARTIQLKIIGCYFERLRCPTKSSGLRVSSILSTAAHKAMPLLLPPAAGHSFGYLPRYAQAVKRQVADLGIFGVSASKRPIKTPYDWMVLLLGVSNFMARI